MTNKNTVNKQLDTLNKDLKKLITNIENIAVKIDDLTKTLQEEKPTNNNSIMSLKELASTTDLLDSQDRIDKDFKDLNTINKQLEVKRLLKRYNCYDDVAEDIDFINDLIKLIVDKDISIKKFDNTLETIKYSNDKSHKTNIKSYTFACLHKL